MRDLLRRMGFVGALLLTLVFAAPAFESHACAEEAAAVTAQVFVDAAPVDDVQCPDCGPACANGCCHASHAAVPAEPHPHQRAVRFSHPVAWSDTGGAPLSRPAGPERPPRI
ncbi:hypothetical protein [Brevundimonas sp.]|uniref:hypothetical protein n=1 Tax=Brevundimonas sp. TaxID=1871086 RepID=UPI003BA8F89E